MSLAQIMAVHGKALGPLGVAVYAWIDANPGTTFKEVADGLGMGESTVKKCVRQFEELDIAERLIESTPKGLCLPTRVSVKSDPGTIERGTSDNPLRAVTPSPQNPVTIEPPEIIEDSLSDPGTIERGTSGTPVAPYSDIRTSTDIKTHTHIPRARKLPDLSPERQAEVDELHAYYCERIDPVALDAMAAGTLNRALGEKGLAFCKKVVDGCALDDWPDRKFNNSIPTIFKNVAQMERFTKIAKVKANGNGGSNGTVNGKRGGGTSLSDRNEAAIEAIYARRAAGRNAGGEA